MFKKTGKVPMRLPPLKQLAVKTDKMKESKPCTVVMSSVLCKAVQPPPFFYIICRFYR